jgi:hypothetical protein
MHRLLLAALIASTIGGVAFAHSSPAHHAMHCTHHCKPPVHHYRGGRGGWRARRSGR